MTLDELQKRCARTTLSWLYPESTHVEQVAMAALWLTSEAGEVANEIRKLTAEAPERSEEGKKRLLNRIAEELGDVIWCVSETATLLGIDLETCVEMQRQKQEARYVIRHEGPCIE